MAFLKGRSQRRCRKKKRNPFHSTQYVTQWSFALLCFALLNQKPSMLVTIPRTVSEFNEQNERKNKWKNITQWWRWWRITVTLTVMAIMMVAVVALVTKAFYYASCFCLFVAAVAFFSCSIHAVCRYCVFATFCCMKWCLWRRVKNKIKA